MAQIAEWLARLGMSEYAERFAENRIDFVVLPDLTDHDLKDIGVVLGDRRKILRAIARLDVVPESVVLPPQAPSVVLHPQAPSSVSVAAVEGLPTEEGASDRGDATLDEIVQETDGKHLSSHYHRFIARAVKGLDRSSAEARRVIYERARKALIGHLRFNQPALSKAAIVKERLALEDAIRKVESGAAHNARREETEPQSAISSVWMPDGGAASDPPRHDDATPASADMPEGGWPGRTRTRGALMLRWFSRRPLPIHKHGGCSMRPSPTPSRYSRSTARCPGLKQGSKY
jgi:hypothetical protein